MGYDLGYFGPENTYNGRGVRHGQTLHSGISIVDNLQQNFVLGCIWCISQGFDVAELVSQEKSRHVGRLFPAADGCS